MEFWTSGTGAPLAGTPESAFLKDFTIIPNNTMALAKIKSFVNVEKKNEYKGTVDKYLNITWSIQSGEFKGHEVGQKIKCFDGTPESIDRNLNMLKLIMTLSDVKPTHGGAPTNEDLKLMHNKMMGIKIREWSMPKADGSGNMEGNFVSEVHPPVGFTSETGVKLEAAYHSPVDSALSRHAGSKAQSEFDDGLPF